MRFRTLLAVLGWSAFALLLAHPASAQTPAVPYTLSPRVGEAVGPEARAYFGLFPRQEGFASARFALDGDSVQVRVRFAPGGNAERDTTWRMSLTRAVALGSYVEAFEGLSAPSRFPAWQAVRGSRGTVLIDAATPTPDVDVARPDVRVLVGEQRYDGVLLAASDTLLLLHPVGRAYDWRAPVPFALDPQDVDWVTMVPERDATRSFFRFATAFAGACVALPFATSGSFRLDSGGEALLLGGLTTGFVVGGAIADRLVSPRAYGSGTYAARLPDLQGGARFRHGFPFDLPPDEAAARGRTSASVPPVRAGRVGSLGWRMAEWRRRYGLFSVAALGPGRVGGQPDIPTFQESIIGAPTPFTSVALREGLVPSVGLDVAVRPVPWVRLGAALQHHATEEPVQEGRTTFMEEVARTAPGPLRAYAEAILPAPALAGYRLELAAGGGIEWNRVATSREGGTVGSAAIPLEYRFEEGGANPFVQATVELVMPRRTSLFLRFTQRSLPTVTVAAFEIPQENPDRPPLYRMDAHAVDFGYRELIWGTRVRL